MKNRPDQHWLVLGSLTAVIGIIALLPSNFQNGDMLQVRASTLRSDPKIELASCSPEDLRYFSLFIKTKDFTEWAKEYHKTVSNILEEYHKPVDDIACDSEELLPVTPKDKLYDIASKLPPWDTAEERQSLRKNDVGFVLLELLRVYECALIDRSITLAVRLENELKKKVDSGELPPEAIGKYKYGNLLQEMLIDKDHIEEELDTARPTLERALQILAGATRLLPLDAELECLQRSSIDISNGFSLATDTSSCLPKIWDARDVLRDTP